MNQISRREVLIGAAAFGLTPVSSKLRMLSPEQGFSFAFFSDTHFGLKSNYDENVSMFAEMKDAGFDFAINGGDVTDYGWVGEYARERAALATVPFKVHHIPGNHDVRWSPLGPKAYKNGTRDPMYSSFDHKGCHFALLDSTVPLSHWGHFESEMLRWLEKDLAKVGRATPVFVFTHHWIGRDTVQTDNECDLLKVIEPYNVKIVFNGHGHSDLLWTWNGIHNTMNRGLYQFSWQKVDVDQSGGFVQLSRRTKEKPTQTELLKVELKPSKEKLAKWAIPASFAAGQVLSVAHPDAKEFRWDDGKWQAIEAAGIATSQLVGGTHRLGLRQDGSTYFDAGQSRVKASNGALHQVWEAELPGGVMSHIRAQGDRVYVSTMDGSVTVLRFKDGKKIWTSKTSGYCHSSPCLTPKNVIVGSAEGNVYAFDIKSGNLIWRAVTNGPVYGSGAVVGEIVAIASGDGSVYGLNVNTGKQIWKYTLPVSNTSFIQSPAATDGNLFFFGAWDSHLYALDALTGELKWRQGCCADRSFAYSPAIGGPVVADGKVVVPANGNVLYAFACADGAPAWETKSPGDKFGYSSPTIHNGKVIVGTLGDGGEGRSVDLATGKIDWTVSTGSVIYDSGPCVVGDVAVFGSVSGLLTAAKLEDGKIVGQFRMPTGHLLATPASLGNRIFAGSYSDKVVALDVVF